MELFFIKTTNSISKSLVDEAALVKKLSDSHSSFLAGSLLTLSQEERNDGGAAALSER